MSSLGIIPWINWMPHIWFRKSCRDAHVRAWNSAACTRKWESIACFSLEVPLKVPPCLPLKCRMITAEIRSLEMITQCGQYSKHNMDTQAFSLSRCIQRLTLLDWCETAFERSYCEFRAGYGWMLVIGPLTSPKHAAALCPYMLWNLMKASFRHTAGHANITCHCSVSQSRNPDRSMILKWGRKQPAFYSTHINSVFLNSTNDRLIKYLEWELTTEWNLLSSQLATLNFHHWMNVMSCRNAMIKGAML